MVITNGNIAIEREAVNPTSRISAAQFAPHLTGAPERSWRRAYPPDVSPGWSAIEAFRTVGIMEPSSPHAYPSGTNTASGCSSRYFAIA